MFDQRKLQAQMALKGVNAKEVAEAIDINIATFYRRLNNNGNFTRTDIQKMINFLDIKNPDEIFFAESDA